MQPCIRCSQLLMHPPCPTNVRNGSRANRTLSQLFTFPDEITIIVAIADISILNYPTERVSTQLYQHNHRVDITLHRLSQPTYVSIDLPDACKMAKPAPSSHLLLSASSSNLLICAKWPFAILSTQHQGAGVQSYNQGIACFCACVLSTSKGKLG